MTDLSILCVTKGEPCVLPMLSHLLTSAHLARAECVIAADGEQAYRFLRDDVHVLSDNVIVVPVQSKGYVESVLDFAISKTSGKYVLRIDDDETISHPLLSWLCDRCYLSHPHWKFNRAHLWSDDYYITNPPLWPDHQSRLSLRELSGGRNSIHAGSPHGGGVLAPYPIYHHKFLVKSLVQRQEVVNRYERLQPGAGSNFAVFSVPEIALEDEMRLAPVSELEQRVA